jgi:hypothetical protein
MTLDTGDQPDHATNRVQQCIAPSGPANIDILCCQSIRRSMDGNDNLTDTLAQSFGFTCSCFAAHRPRLGKPDQKPKRGVSGLAIMVGNGVWMLNSGSVAVPGDQEGEEGIVQFALVRKNGASILVLNLQIAAAKPAQRVQLQALFSHPLLKERYGAVVLCADRTPALSSKALQAITTRSDYILRSSLKPAQAGTGNGMMCLLTTREKAATAVTIGSADVLPAAGLTIEFDINRTDKDMKNRPYLPLSFSEQWMGGRERYVAFAP